MAPTPLIVVLESGDALRQSLQEALGRRYGDRYRVLSFAGASELEKDDSQERRSAPIALLLVAHAPGVTCQDVIRAAGPLAPYAKRLVMVDYDDAARATELLRQRLVDAYLVKPMEPFERYLYPVTDDALGDWWATHRPLADEIQVYGYRWCPRTFEIKDFLSRHEIPYRWHDLRLPLPEDVAGKVDRSQCAPVVRLPKGELLTAPPLTTLAERLGLSQLPQRDFYDVVIIGAGPAGLATAVYGASEGLRTLVVESRNAGGQAGSSSLIENYLGFPAGLTGADLTRRALAQAGKFGAEILTPVHPQRVQFGTAFHRVMLTDGREIGCHTLVLATGVQYRRLEAANADRFNGAGIYYGSVMSEAPLCSGEEVFVVGGGNSAGQAALHLSKFAQKVTILVRGAGLSETMSQYLIDEIKANPRVEIRAHVVVSGLGGEDHLEEVTLTDVRSHAQEKQPAKSLFVFIGAQPETACFEDRLARDEQGYILTGPAAGARTPGRQPCHLETSVPGVFAIGDVRHESVKRVAGAVGDGAAVVQFIHRHLATR